MLTGMKWMRWRKRSSSPVCTMLVTYMSLCLLKRKKELRSGESNPGRPRDRRKY